MNKKLKVKVETRKKLPNGAFLGHIKKNKKDPSKMDVKLVIYAESPEIDFKDYRNNLVTWNYTTMGDVSFGIKLKSHEIMTTLNPYSNGPDYSLVDEKPVAPTNAYYIKFTIGVGGRIFITGKIKEREFDILIKYEELTNPSIIKARLNVLEYYTKEFDIVVGDEKVDEPEEPIVPEIPEEEPIEIKEEEFYDIKQNFLGIYQEWYYSIKDDLLIIKNKNASKFKKFLRMLDLIISAISIPGLFFFIVVLMIFT